MITPPPPLSIQKIGLRNGLVAGILMIIYSLVLYIMGGDLLFRSSLLFLAHLIPIILMIVTIQMYRKQNGNYISFRSAFGGAFAVAVPSFLLLAVFSFILYRFVDPELVARYKQYSIEQTIEWMQWANAPEEQIDKQIDELKNQDFTPTVKFYAMGYVVGLVFAAIYAVILALIFWLVSRKYEPAPQFDQTGFEK